MSPPTLFPPRKLYHLVLPANRTLTLGGRTLLMGVLNVTPDSFADGGLYADAQQAADAALRMEDEGADLIDIGGESTRPGAPPLDAGEEQRRVIPVLEALQGRLSVPVSVDTYKAAVAREALDRGASIVNDISGLRYDPGLASVVAERQVPLILMHTRGRSREMYREASYESVVDEVAAELAESVSVAVAAGVSREQLLLDPGLGFAKRPEHTYTVLTSLPAFAALDRPLVVGPSRKSFLQKALSGAPPDRRDWGTAAAVSAAVLLGAHVVRVHAVKPMVDVIRVADEIRNAG